MTQWGKPRRRVLTLGVVAVAAVAMATAAVPGLRWRTQIVWLKLRGELPEIRWSELARMVQPKGRYYLEPLVRSRSGYRTIRNPWATAADDSAGGTEFARRCATCHGPEGRGATGPDLTGPTLTHGDSDWALYRVIKDGVPGSAMPGHDIGDRPLWQLITHLRSLRPQVAVERSDVETAWDVSPVTPERLVAAASDSGNWLMYHGSYDGQRHSRLRQITPASVSRLQLVWLYQTKDPLDRVETSPLVVDDAMYLTEPNDKVVALDAATGRVRWRYEPSLPPDLNLCCNPVSRGVAIRGTTLFLATADARLIALEARTGAVEWEATLADYRQGYSMTSAPLVVGDLVIAGIAGGEYGIRGFIDAYRAADGTRAWRFYTIPAPGDRGSETWPADALATGGGPAWLTGTYDPELGLVYFGVGNPGPVYDGSGRGGDNLYTNSVVALRAATGEMAWYFQFTPHDIRDYDAVQVPILADLAAGERTRRLMFWANKNGFYYVLDRESGAFLAGRPFSRQTWATELDSTGRPVENPAAAPTRAGVLVFPSTIGATNWWSPSYSPRTGLVYIPTREQGAVFFTGEDEYEPGSMFTGGGGREVGEDAITALRAVDGLTGERRWEFVYPPPTPWYLVGGALSTAGGVVLTGAASDFVALDDRTGALLWRYNTGGRIMAAPITFLQNGRQHVSIAAGRAVLTFALPAADR